MVCKLCGQDRRLIRAHVIPRSFFEIDPGAPPKILTNRDNEHPKRSPIGIYDSELVCESCEQLFAPFDDYAHALLLEQRDAQETIFDAGEPIAFVYESFDYSRLKLFLLSVLWRAAHSAHGFFSGVDLGSRHESAIKRAILSHDAGGAETYAAFLARFPKPLGMLNPHQTRISDSPVNFVQIYLAEYVAYLKVDQRSTPDPFRDFVLAPGAPLVVLGRNPAKSQDAKVMRKLVKLNPRAFRSKHG